VENGVFFFARLYPMLEFACVLAHSMLIDYTYIGSLLKSATTLVKREVCPTCSDVVAHDTSVI
jgi:hypothetical protein